MGFHALTIHFLVVSNQTDQFLDWPVLTYLAYFAQELQLISIGFPARFFQKKSSLSISQKLVDYMYIFHFDLFEVTKRVDQQSFVDIQIIHDFSPSNPTSHLCESYLLH